MWNRGFRTFGSGGGGGGGANGFIASVVNVAIQLATRIGLAQATEVKPGVAIDATRHTARVEQLPAVQTSLLGATGDASVATNPAMQVAASLRSLGADAFPQNPAVVVAQSLRDVAAASTQQNPAVVVALNGVTGESSKPEAKPGLAMSPRISEFNTQQLPAMEIVRVKYDLVRRVGGNSVTESAVGGRTDWANDANATGLNDGTMATFAGNALGARGGQLELSYADAVNKGDLTITSATLLFYGRVFNTILNNADVQLRYDTGAGFVTLLTITGDDDFRSTPKSFALGANLDTWAKYDALRAACRADAAIAETWQAELDAVEIEIVATRTDAL